MYCGTFFNETKLRVPPKYSHLHVAPKRITANSNGYRLLKEKRRHVKEFKPGIQNPRCAHYSVATAVVHYTSGLNFAMAKHAFSLLGSINHC